MSAFPKPGGAGGGLLLRSPPDQFSAATEAAAAAARDAAITDVPAALALFDENPNLAVILVNTGTDPRTTKYQVRRGGAWADVTAVVTGPAGEDGIDGAAAGRLRLEAYAADADGAKSGNSIVRTSFGDFLIGWNPPEGAARLMLALPAGKVLSSVLDVRRANEIGANFDRQGRTQNWLYDRDFRGRQLIQVTIEDE